MVVLGRGILGDTGARFLLQAAVLKPLGKFLAPTKRNGTTGVCFGQVSSTSAGACLGTKDEI